MLFSIYSKLGACLAFSKIDLHYCRRSGEVNRLIGGANDNEAFF